MNNIGFEYIEIDRAELVKYKHNEKYLIPMPVEIKNISKVSNERAKRVFFLEKHLAGLMNYFINEGRDKSHL